LANLSAQANRLVKGKTGPALSEEGIHKVLGEILGEHGELCHVQFRISRPPVVIFCQPPKIIIADGLLLSHLISEKTKCISYVCQDQVYTHTIDIMSEISINSNKNVKDRYGEPERGGVNGS
jgi:hypothetical protein